MQEIIARADDAIEAGLGEADRFEIVLLLGLRQHGDFAFDLGRDDDRDRAFFGRLLAHLIGKALPLSAAASSTLQT